MYSPGDPNSPQAGEDSTAEAEAFARNPARYAHADWLTDVLPADLLQPLGNDLAAIPRFQERLSARLESAYGLPPWSSEAESEVPWALVLLQPERRARLVALCGILWFGQALRLLVEAKILRTYLKAVSEEDWCFAVSSAEFAPKGQPLPDPDWLPEGIDLAGTACVAAWIAARPGPLRARLRLAFPKDSPFLESYAGPAADFGPALVQHVLAAEKV